MRELLSFSLRMVREALKSQICAPPKSLLILDEILKITYLVDLIQFCLFTMQNMRA
jgi:hypothetical protein